MSDWFHSSLPLTEARIQRTLHFSAASLALGMLAGLYLRALGLEYRAGWESTFIEAPALHQLLQWLLGPASALTGIAVPDPEHLARLRWSATQPGENAAAWIHLQAVTVALLVILPRLFISAWYALRVLRLQANFPFQPRQDPFLRRLLLATEGTGGRIVVIPHRYQLPGDAAQNLQRLLARAWGEQAQAEIASPIPYGEEAEQVAERCKASGPEDQKLVVLFNLSATPEAESQGLLLDELRERMSQRGVIVLVDESSFAARMRGQPDAEKRLEQRRAAWIELLQSRDAVPIFVDLAEQQDSERVSHLEAVLSGASSSDPAVHAGRDKVRPGQR